MLRRKTLGPWRGFGEQMVPRLAMVLAVTLWSMAR
jgi:hypothetical protein